MQCGISAVVNLIKCRFEMLHGSLDIVELSEFLHILKPKLFEILELFVIVENEGRYNQYRISDKIWRVQTF